LLAVIEPTTGVLQRCMVDMVPLRQTDLTGRPTANTEVYRFGIWIDVYGSWGEDPYPDRFLDHGLSPTIVGWEQSPDAENVWLKRHGKHVLRWSR
jgi:hypothetical protein